MCSASAVTVAVSCRDVPPEQTHGEGNGQARVQGPGIGPTLAHPQMHDASATADPEREVAAVQLGDLEWQDVPPEHGLECTAGRGAGQHPHHRSASAVTVEIVQPQTEALSWGSIALRGQGRPDRHLDKHRFISPRPQNQTALTPPFTAS